ncbi:MAG: LysE family translocator [Alphaproteobacteria bacterium]|nr:LysE family translocator [Alphaproteobacteria bacterium]
MTVTSTIAFAATMLVFALSPGPGVVAVVSTAVSRGFWPATALGFGLVLGDLVYLLFAAFGLSLIAEVLGELFVIVRYLGAAYLIWLGIQAWRARPDTPAAHVETGRAGLFRSLAGGFFVTLGNPKVIVFYLGFLPAFLDLANLTAIDLLIVVGIVVGIGTATMADYALLAAHARRWLGSARGVTWMNRSAGTLLVGAGVAVAVKS